MVADLRARLADELEEHYPTWSNDCGCGEEIGSARWQAEHVADVLLALPGIAIVDIADTPSIYAALAAARARRGLFCPTHHAWHPGPVCDPQEAP